MRSTFFLKRKSVVRWSLPGLFFIVLCSSCISFNLNSLKDVAAEGVTFQPPPAPYKKVVKKGMDASWENPEEGSTVSFFSNCSSASQFTSLEQFQKELLDGLRAFHVLDKKETLHQNQKAYYLKLSQFKNKSSEKKETVNMELFLFKKANCFYALSFLLFVVDKSASNQTQVFKNFIQGFLAP